MTNKQYDIIYLFENKMIALFETKLKNVIVDDRSKLYQWFLYDKENNKLQPLIYENRKNEDNIEYRIFDTSSLSFDNEGATYCLNDKEIELKRIDTSLPIDKKIKELTDDYFNSLEIKNNN